jgi:2,5-furandicarboxylate decarboxylase 1
MSLARDIDMDRFRLRTFVERLRQHDMLDVIETPIPLVDVASKLDGNENAVLFERAAGSSMQLVGNVVGSRERLALAFDVHPNELLQEVRSRLARPIKPYEVESKDAPVHEVIWSGDEIDLTRLPIHLQHSLDGGPFISASIDICTSLDGTKRNVGYRRLMLRGRTRTGIDLIAPSDLRVLYQHHVSVGKPMPMAFVIGSHPADSVAATAMNNCADEVELMGALRGAPVPLVKCITFDGMVPADAELVIEGYLDERGWVEPEGPFGEYVGYYGMMKTNPVFHVTAITMRKDAMFQTATIGGRHLARTDTAQLCALRTEVAAWQALDTAIREPVAVYCTASCGGMYNLRVSMRPNYPGEVRNAITAVFGSKADVKHVFVMDADVDIFSDEQFDWAFATRFQADRDLVVVGNMRAIPLDPSLQGSRSGAKAGFDLTMPLGANGKPIEVPVAPNFETKPSRPLDEVIAQGPQTFFEIMQGAGITDERDAVLAIEPLIDSGRLSRLPDGRYELAKTT